MSCDNTPSVSASELSGGPDVTAPASTGAVRPYACVYCKKRKSRCDRGHPCSVCVRAGVECVPGTRAPYSSAKRMLRANRSQQLERSRSPNPLVEGVTNEPECLDRPSFSQNLWLGLNHEFQDPRGPKSSLDERSQHTGSQTNAESPVPDPTSLLWGTHADVDLLEVHPSPSHALLLWQTFLYYVNPLTKAIHVPTVQILIDEASKNVESLSRPTAALVFAIYSAAIMSMKDDDCRHTLGECKNTLLVRYVTTTQHMLAASGFMKSVNVVILQAFVVHLVAVQHFYDAQTNWMLAGLATRMGQRLKLHVEFPGDSFSPFEIQMRRRIWWQILIIDSRSAQLAGTQNPLTVDIVNFPLPANVDDVDMKLDMPDAPEDVNGPTEMLYCLLRYEVGRFQMLNGKRMHSTSTPFDEKERLIGELENQLEVNYLRYCDPAIPVHLLAAGGARSAICKMKLTVHHPSNYPEKGATMPRAIREKLLFNSLKMVEYDVLGQSVALLENFSWHLDAYHHLDALIFMLIESRNQPTGPMTDKAWQLVSDTFRYKPKLLEDTSELFVAIRDYTLRAWEAREAELARQGPVIVPPAITTLRLAKQAGTVSPRHNGDQDVSVAPMMSPGMSRDLPYLNEFMGWEETDWEFWNLLHNTWLAQQPSGL